MLLRYWKKSCNECNIVILETSFTDQDPVYRFLSLSLSLPPSLLNLSNHRPKKIDNPRRCPRGTDDAFRSGGKKRKKGKKKKRKESGRANKVVVNPDLGGRERDNSRSGESSLDERVLAEGEETRRAAIFVSPGWTRWWIIRELPALSLFLGLSLATPAGICERYGRENREQKRRLVAACRAACTRYLVVSGPCSSRKKNV